MKKREIQEKAKKKRIKNGIRKKKFNMKRLSFFLVFFSQSITTTILLSMSTSTTKCIAIILTNQQQQQQQNLNYKIVIIIHMVIIFEIRDNNTAKKTNLKCKYKTKTAKKRNK